MHLHATRALAQDMFKRGHREKSARHGLRRPCPPPAVEIASALFGAKPLKLSARRARGERITAPHAGPGLHQPILSALLDACNAARRRRADRRIGRLVDVRVRNVPAAGSRSASGRRAGRKAAAETVSGNPFAHRRRAILMCSTSTATVAPNFRLCTDIILTRKRRGSDRLA